MEKPVHDIFQKGLIRGAERLPYDPAKRYFYVEHPTEGWRVYLRACAFIHERPQAARGSASDGSRELIHEKPAAGQCIDPARFIVVKRAGTTGKGKDWEPPKGQMEGKDGLRNPRQSIMGILKDNIYREVGEEARIHSLQGLEHTGLILEDKEPDFPPNTFFQYHIFRALVPEKAWMTASQELDWYRAHPAAFARLKRDKKEKDAIDWYSPSDTKLMGRWSPRLVVMYLKKYAS